jgi:S1-C subfamily serine protease
MTETGPDERIEVTVLRDGERETVAFRLATRPPP